MTMPTWARVGLVLFVALMLQLSVVADLRLWGVTGNALVVAPVAAGLLGGPERGATVGFAAGLLFDAFVTTPFGLTALVWTVTGYATGLLGRNLIRSTPIGTIAFAVAAAIGSTTLFVLVGTLLGQDHLLDAPVVRILVVGALLAAGAVLLMQPAMRWALTDPHDPVHARR
ncbi:rod shape-determining protein MreD [Actinomarinicola tropica]|uniref:Rod shape-determining protein MreD n=1 Tax=Actinomarinicola tropica TaxID=2789776 RepID=A0A5Q2RNN7_9ACTN|nr:rod shape-determining protein MreD [Actinomarinicola tropica]QGG95707.1 rod shape-determining protein MreD [Actinomarinicola tropica]